MAGCGTPAEEPEGTDHSGSGGMAYLPSRYFSSLILEVNDVVFDRGDGELWTTPIEPETPDSCVVTTRLAFSTTSGATSGDLFFARPFADGSEATMPSAPFAEEVLSLVLRDWDGLDFVAFSGGTVLYSMTDSQHILTLNEAVFCEVPNNYVPGIDLATCIAAEARLEFTGELGTDLTSRVGIAGWDSPLGTLCVVPS
jgi:hypothetical protein